jgi:hypothetical protein
MRNRDRTDLLVLILAPALAAFASARARATTLVRMSLEQLAQASSDIVRGQAVSQASGWNTSHTLIMTVTRIAVETRMKGQAPETVDIEQPGGTVGNFRVYVPGTVHFLPGAKYLLFLEPSKATPAHYQVVGMVQGAYRIYADAATGEEKVIRPLGTMFYGPAIPSAQTTSLSQFRQQLSGALQTPLVIPKGTVIVITVQQTEMSGVGRLQLEGRTARDLFPNRTTVVPAGSRVDGAAQKEAGVWKVRWSEVVVRGTAVPISATTEESGNLRGKTLVVRVQ